MRGSPTLLPGEAFEPDRLLSPEAAVAAYLAQVRVAPVGVEAVSLDDAYDRILSTDAVASDDLPAAARSTMDGFAVDAAQLPGRLRITGEIAMGHAPPSGVGPGETLRIPTGGMLPGGATAVVPFEDVEERGGEILVSQAVAAGENLTARGADIRAGETVLRAGRRIGGAELGVLATLGLAQAPVFRRPRIAIISTGDELVDVDRRPGPGQVRDSNRFAIAGALRAMGAIPVHAPRAGDTITALRASLSAALAGSDAVMLTGGSSVGARDLTPEIINALGEPGVVIHGIRVKPGKPTVFAAVGAVPVIGLPGNPTSALMILEAVVAPIIAALTGAAQRVPVRRGIAAEPIAGRRGWTWYVPVDEDAEGRVTPLPLRSAHTSLLARATGYVIVGERKERYAAGDPVVVHPFSQAAR